MATTQISSPLPSPGVGVRRKGPKSLPRLPLSAFSPPNSGTSDRFPLPPSPGAVHPDKVIDGHLVVKSLSDLAQWKKEAGQGIGGRIAGVVAKLETGDVDKALQELESSTVPILSIAIPFQLQSWPPSPLPSSSKPLVLSTAYTGPAQVGVSALKWALENGRAVDMQLQCDIMQDNTLWEDFEDLLSKATADAAKITPIILSNVLPPPNSLAIPLVKLITHPSYQAYQSHIAALSLFPNLYVKLLPPNWNAPTPSISTDEKEAKEWKRRLRMYIGPVIEAFGYERIIFGSSPTGSAPSHAGDWYEIARESIAELGVEQPVIDGIFYANAQAVYGE